MKTKKIVLGASALVLVGSALLLTNSAYAYRGDYTQKSPDCTPERHETMEQAFKNNDYSAWKEQMNGKGRVTQVVNESNFAKFAEAHRLAEEGKYDEADQIRQELGLRTKNGDSLGGGYGKENKLGQGYRNSQ